MPYDKRKKNVPAPPQPGWAVYLRTSSDENQKPELSRARQRFAIEENVLKRSDLPVIDEYVDVLTGKTPDREGYQRLLADARVGRFSYVIVERADRFGRNDTEALRAIDELHEFGVAVRFANSPDLDPMDPDDRVIVALSFTLARRESTLLGIRVKGGLQAKRQSGGFCGVAPDGYRNVEDKVLGEAKKLQGRHNHWIEQDPERAALWRYAWNLLLENELTLEQICETLHARGHKYRSGRPFVQVKKNGKRVANTSTLAAIFHNWTYAGWVTSKSGKLPPKTIKGNWEPIVTTEEFERGLAILEQRDLKRGRERRHDYLLKGMLYFDAPGSQGLIRLTCSTSNASRVGGGTQYYCIARSNINFLCSSIDGQIPDALHCVQVDPDLIPMIRAAYTDDIAEKMGHLRPDEREQLLAALKSIDEEEVRMMRLYAAGKVTENLWDMQWQEWQDRRARIRLSLEGLEGQQQVYIENLDAALKIIAQVGIVYNRLERSDQKELLRYMVERVIVDPAGQIRLELCAPFAYLQDITDQVRSGAKAISKGKKAKTARISSGLGSGNCSDSFLSCGKDWITFEHLSPRETAQFLDSLPFPQRESLAPFITNPN
ncbi:MAG: recombinase family protein [Chloroflexi bacterium]|uniref:recombinase family protein n=1 Tax=Candidatus Flexifilum breve TaxID=3140694 RepID=UPI003135E6C5|nr:recombinase family protein [Chloroflexota bacterium]